MRPSRKRKQSRSAFIGSFAAGLIFAPIVVLIYFGTKNVGHGLEIFFYLLLVLDGFLLAMGIIGIIVTSIKPFIECTEIGIDAKGKKYLVANDSSWFFNNLTSTKVDLIKNRINELEQWKHERLKKHFSEKGKERFLEKYNYHVQKAFYCYIYRSGTRYTQSNYVKTPYTGTSEYWSEYYSVESIKTKLHI